MIDEDEIEEVVTLGGAEVAVLCTGLDMAMLRARGAFVAGRLDVAEFEREVERILRKRAALRGDA